MIDLEKFRVYFNRRDAFSVSSGMQLTELREGYAKAELTIDEDSMNYMGTMHGGLLYTMADVAAGTAVVYLGQQCVTLSANTDYYRSASAGKVIAEARVISAGKTVCRCEVEVHGEDRTVYSRSHITMYITDREIDIGDAP